MYLIRTRVKELRGGTSSSASSTSLHAEIHRNQDILSGSVAEKSKDSNIDAAAVNNRDDATAIHGSHDPQSQAQQLQSLIGLEISVLLKIAYVNLELKNWSVVVDAAETVLDKVDGVTVITMPSDTNASL